MPLRLQFKTKPRRGMIRRPELTPAHVVKGGPVNYLGLKMAVRRAESSGWRRPPVEFPVDRPPEGVAVDASGYLAVVTFTVP